MTRRLTIWAIIGALLFVPVFAMSQDPIKKPDVSKLRKQSTSSTTTSSSSSATPKPTTGSLSVQYTPNGASVYVDGTEKGVTPCEISGLSVGSHTVKISLRGYETATRTVSITANGVREIAGTLTKQAVAATTTSSTGSISGHDYVDLGLSVKWATMNVGASSPEDYGSYFAWGETSVKSSYTADNCSTYGKSIGDIGGDSSTDAARANWGGSWRLPTKEEFQELIDNCNWTWTTQGGKSGYKVTGPNGNSIFLPAAGYRYGTSLLNAGERGRYWSSTPDEDNSYYAYCLGFYSSIHYVYGNGRYYGRTVRPVSE